MRAAIENIKEKEYIKGKRVSRILIKKGEEVYHGISGKMEPQHASRACLKAFVQEEVTNSGGDVFQRLITLWLERFVIYCGITSGSN